mgnify:CR=1 FL=1
MWVAGCGLWVVGAAPCAWPPRAALAGCRVAACGSCARWWRWKPVKQAHLQTHCALRVPNLPLQACEFDYSGTQACKALKAEGYRVVLVNSNPATIMTDPETADRTYVGPMTPELVEQIIAKEKPDAILPTMGGKTALNLAKALSEGGLLDK